MNVPGIPDNFLALNGQVAVVTGGGSGIGRATSLLLAQAGASVAVFDLNYEAAGATVKLIEDNGGRATAVTADVGDELVVEREFRTICEREGGINILVNNAGLAIRRPATELALEDWQRVIDVNMTGVFLCSRIAARQMIGSGTPGAIVTVASIMGLSGGGLYPNISYQTSKGAVVNMTRALAVEWAPYGIRVNAVAPTYVRTPFIAPLLSQPDLVARIEQMTPLRRLAEPEEVAAAILFLASPGAAMITGHTLPVDGGFLAQ
jgi:NAD(P)-dependent dehydrogenase (short-subunit alcohol dehydrogenase family)